MSLADDPRNRHEDIIYPSTVPFVLFHVACLAAIWSGITWQAVIICVTLYWLRLFAIGAGYHRYFSHRSFSTSRVFQFILAFLAQSSAQRSILWWAAKHRKHHRHSDTEDDVHSPRRTGFVYSHVGWIFARAHSTIDVAQVPDFACYPELLWLHRWELVPPAVLGMICFLLGGWPGLVVGFLWSTVLVYHATFCINSLAHVWGKQRYVTGDDSRNNWLLAFFTMGEGWHNNHHAYQASVRQGFHWWEFDPTYYVLKVLSWCHLVWDLRMPPASLLRNERRLGSLVIHRAAEQLAARFNAEQIAVAVKTALVGSGSPAWREAIACGRRLCLTELMPLTLAHMPTLADFRSEARTCLARTPSLDDIVSHAREILLVSVGMHLEVSAEGGDRPC
jgi:stearoyl-CoA desaturase (delta-9 desaturase)